MIPTTWGFTVNFTTKNHPSELKFEKKKFRFPQGVFGSVSKSENDRFVMSDGIFFFCSKESLSWFFFGVKFIGDYRNVEIIPTLFWDHRQKSKKPNFSSFFSTFDRDAEVII